MNRPLLRTVPAVLAATALANTCFAQVNWTSVSATGAPAAFCGYAWDSARNRLVAFGGEAATLVDATREWDGSQWLLVNPPVRPTARTRPAMAFDAARGNVVLFGGGGGTTFTNQTWTYDGATWTQRTPATTPPVRYGAALAYDSDRQVVVMFGGFEPGGNDRADTWEWNGTNWTLRSPAGAVPLARGAHRMVYDEARGVTVLYGGYSSPQQNTLSDTWLWNGTTWTQGGGGPGSLCDQAMAYDAARQRVVLYGGLRITGPGNLIDLAGTWDWNGTSWTSRPTAASPGVRSSGANGYDPTSNRVVLAGGGIASGTQFSDTWTMAPTNAASVQSFGAGCPTSAGTVELRAASLPYIGSDFVQVIDGAPATAVVGGVIFGFSNVNYGGIGLPFDLTPIGAPGCSLLVSVDVLATVLLVNGTGDTTWSLPNLPAAVGLPLFTQALVIDPLSTLQFPIGLSSGRQFVIGAP